METRRRRGAGGARPRRAGQRPRLDAPDRRRRKWGPDRGPGLPARLRAGLRPPARLARAAGRADRPHRRARRAGTGGAVPARRRGRMARGTAARTDGPAGRAARLGLADPLRPPAVPERERRRHLGVGLRRRNGSLGRDRAGAPRRRFPPRLRTRRGVDGHRPPPGSAPGARRRRSGDPRPGHVQRRLPGAPPGRTLQPGPGPGSSAVGGRRRSVPHARQPPGRDRQPLRAAAGAHRGRVPHP